MSRRDRDWIRLARTMIVAALVLGWPLDLRAAPPSGHQAFLGARLIEAIQQAQSPGEKIPISVTLERDDLEPPGLARRNAIRARQNRALGAMGRGQFEMSFRFESLSGFAGRAPAAAIQALSRHPNVVAIHLDYEVHASLAQGNALIGADTLHTMGLTGAGITVAVLDTGIDTDHADLVDDLVDEQCFCDEFPQFPNFGACCPAGGTTQSGPGAAEDDEGHGTHTAGIISSGGVVSSVGVAPDAGIVAIKVLAANGSGSSSSIAAGLDWIVTNHAVHGIKVVNMSLGNGLEHNNPAVAPCTGTNTSNAATLLHAADIAVFAASGNDAHDDGISEPACIAEVISVGGVYDASIGSVGWCGNASCTEILCTDASAPDGFVCHSNSDEILDVLAPDYNTTSPAVGGGIDSFGGTSAASPYAAGLAALLLEADGTLQPEDIRTLLKGHGPMVTNPDNGLSFRRTDISLALASFTVCGDSVVDFGEDCDDGNNLDGDCCSSTCDFEAVASSCDDGDACTATDQCDGAGTCVSGGMLNCDDANGCTDDSCDPGTGCLNVDNVLACDDGDMCTTTDVCSLGACVGGPALDCDDANGCTDDSCDVATGCVNSDNILPCEDGNACTTLDTCALGSCVPGAPLDCNDSNACTDDSCDTGLGCLNADNTAPCDDGNACTSVDVCALGACTGGAPLGCDDSDSCTDDSCDIGLGCLNVDNTAACDDGDPCTAESCDAITGCANTPIIGCPAPVPSGSSGSRAILLALILASVVLISSEGVRLSNRRRS